ncbi:hypothetical protein ES703_14664 [subsurface metagenome]
MEPKTEETKFVIVAVGKTYPIKDELKSLGFKWNQVNKVWYHVGGLSPEHYEFLTELRDFYLHTDISFRHFEVSGTNWNEIQYQRPS